MDIFQSFDPFFAKSAAMILDAKGQPDYRQELGRIKFFKQIQHSENATNRNF